MNNPTQLTLAVDDESARARFTAAVAALLEAKIPAPRLIVELDGEGLNAALISTLVSGLRQLREVGGAIAVEPRTPALRDAFALYGLDRVFALPLDPEAAPRTHRRPWMPRVASAALATVGALVAVFGALNN